MERFDLLCIGTAIADCLIRGFDPEPVSTYGYTADSCAFSAGGEAVNSSVTAAKLGLKTAILCSLGNDAAGSMIEKTLTDNGVYTGTVVKEDAPTPITVIFVNPDGNRRSITNLAHKRNYHPERYLDLIDCASAVSVGSLFRAPFNDPEIIRKVLERAKEKGIPVFADTKMPNFVRLGLEDIKDSLPFIDYIFPNEDESRYYTGKEDPEERADVFLSYGVKNAVIKIGAEGCLLKNAGGVIRLPAYRIDAVDATGSGDNFLAGFISEKLRGADDLQTLKFASACGAICATAVGACGALKSREQVLAFMEERG